MLRAPAGATTPEGQPILVPWLSDWDGWTGCSVWLRHAESL